MDIASLSWDLRLRWHIFNVKTEVQNKIEKEEELFVYYNCVHRKRDC